MEFKSCLIFKNFCLLKPSLLRQGRVKGKIGILARCQVTREPNGVERLYFLKFWATLNYDYATLQFGNIQFICHKKCMCIKPVRFFFMHFILFS